MKIEFHVVTLDSVIAHFVKDYEHKPVTYEFYVDTAKGRVILELYIEEHNEVEE